MSAWDGWADVYDLADGDRARDIAFYRDLVGPGTRSVLDLACGTGAITVGLARELAAVTRAAASSARVVGIDQSTEMLRVARNRCGRGIAWIRGDMRSIPVSGPFDLVVCCYISFQYLLGEGHLAKALKEVRTVIADDGVLAFDIYQPDHEYLEAGHLNRLARRVPCPAGLDLELREDAHYDPNSRILTVDWRLLDRNGRPDRPLRRLRQKIRQYLPSEIEELLAASGFVIEQRFGDLDRTPFTSRSRKQVYVCTPQPIAGHPNLMSAR